MRNGRTIDNQLIPDKEKAAPEGTALPPDVILMFTDYLSIFILIFPQRRSNLT